MASPEMRPNPRSRRWRLAVWHAGFLKDRSVSLEGRGKPSVSESPHAPCPPLVPQAPSVAGPPPPAPARKLKAEVAVNAAAATAVVAMASPGLPSPRRTFFASLAAIASAHSLPPRTTLAKTRGWPSSVPAHVPAAAPCGPSCTALDHPAASAASPVTAAVTIHPAATAAVHAAASAPGSAAESNHAAARAAASAAASTRAAAAPDATAAATSQSPAAADGAAAATAAATPHPQHQPASSQWLQGGPFRTSWWWGIPLLRSVSPHSP